MGNKPPGKLRQADLDYFRHITTFTDAEICTHKIVLFVINSINLVLIYIL